MAARRTTAAAGKLAFEAQANAVLEYEVKQLREDHNSLKVAAAAEQARALQMLRVELSGTAAEIEAARAEREKEARVEALHKKAARRIQNQGIMRGWSTWQEQWEERARERRMLASAGARLLRPKLAASLAAWHKARGA